MGVFAPEPALAEHVAQIAALAENEFQGGLKKGSMSKLLGLECWPPAEPDETAKDYFARATDKSKGKKGRVGKPCAFDRQRSTGSWHQSHFMRKLAKMQHPVQNFAKIVDLD